MNGKRKVTWLDGIASAVVATSRIMQKLLLQEEEAIFDGPRDPGRAASLTHFTKLLQKGSIDAALMPRNIDGARLFQGLVYSDSTNGLAEAIAWFNSSDSTFDPDVIAGHHREHLPGIPGIPNSVDAILNLHKRLSVDSTDPAAQKLSAFFDMQPIFLYRRGDRQSALETKIHSRCKLLLQGH